MPRDYRFAVEMKFCDSQPFTLTGHQKPEAFHSFCRFEGATVLLCRMLGITMKGGDDLILACDIFSSAPEPAETLLPDLLISFSHFGTHLWLWNCGSRWKNQSWWIMILSGWAVFVQKGLEGRGGHVRRQRGAPSMTETEGIYQQISRKCEWHSGDTINFHTGLQHDVLRSQATRAQLFITGTDQNSFCRGHFC